MFENEFLQIAVDEAITRIRKAYKETEGKIYLSFSGGKDSTVVAELIKMAKLETNIPFVFADTKIELDATYNFVKNYDYDNIIYLKPRKPMAQIMKEYGKPVLSKEKSNFLGTYHRNIDKNPRELVTFTRLLGTTGDGRSRLADKHFHLLHPDLEYKIENKCCMYMKKYPFQDYSKANGMKGTFTGIRVAEGGVRSQAYKSCTVFRKKGKNTELLSMPIFDWSDELVADFIETYNVKLSDAYEIYGFGRTGCIGCPYNKVVNKDLEVLQKHEPKKYKACLNWYREVYADTGVELPFDAEYTKFKEERDVLNKKRRMEMMGKYSDVRNFKELTKAKLINNCASSCGVKFESKYDQLSLDI